MLEQVRANELNVEKCPLLFPKLCCALVEHGFDVRVSGRKRTDFKMHTYLVSFLITRDISEIPDVAIWDVQERVWVEISIENVSLKLGDYGELIYSRKLIDAIGSSNAGVVADYVTLNSSAEITVTY